MVKLGGLYGRLPLLVSLGVILDLREVRSAPEEKVASNEWRVAS